MPDRRTIAYFSMEIGLSANMPTYSGGLGVLAGDTLTSAADLGLPVVAVTLLHRKGYFRQALDPTGVQSEAPQPWPVEEILEELPTTATLSIAGRSVIIRAWLYEVRGAAGHTVPVYLLDADLPANSSWDRSLTDHLYGGDAHYRLCQEVVLGLGGVRLLRAMGYRDIQCFHVNEGHASLLLVELLAERMRRSSDREPTPEIIDAVRRQCVFTTHTPVPAGHDRFPLEMVAGVLDERTATIVRKLSDDGGPARPDQSAKPDQWVNMTQLALRLCGYVNGVSQRHGEVCRRMFAPQPIDAITNGVHHRNWTAPPFRELFDLRVPRWAEDAFSLRHALGIPDGEILNAHAQAKGRLLDYVTQATGASMELNTFTTGFARRTAAYKRADLLFHDPDRLLRIAGTAGPLQLIYAGKAHPHDQEAKELIRRAFQARERLRQGITMAYLPDYDMELCKLMTAGVDLWLNTPEPPLEASGTSGMKAALNGVPSLSVLDGWWVEGCIEGVTGWAIGDLDLWRLETAGRETTARSLYYKLEHVILPLYYRDTPRYVSVMKHCIAVNGSYFNTQRMVGEYLARAYFPR